MQNSTFLIILTIRCDLDLILWSSGSTWSERQWTQVPFGYVSGYILVQHFQQEWLPVKRWHFLPFNQLLWPWPSWEIIDHSKLYSHGLVLVQGYKFLLFIVSEKGPTLTFATDRRTDDGGSVHTHFCVARESVSTYALARTYKTRYFLTHKNILTQMKIKNNKK